MKVYVMMEEQSTCLNPVPCQTQTCNHRRTAPVMVTSGPISTKASGPQQRATLAIKRGVFAMVYEADVEWRCAYTEDEQAVLRTAGPKALRKLLNAKKRQAAKEAGLPARPKVKHAIDTKQEGGQWNGSPWHWCVCGRSWTSRCSKLKMVTKAKGKP